MGKGNTKIAVLSGKGGTGKTFVSVNLAVLAAATYIDCDVEEPNGSLFFKPTDTTEQVVNIKIPMVADNLCTGCKRCVEFCRFNALAYASKVIVFDDVCHACGGCMLVCPPNAIAEKDKRVGIISQGVSGDVRVVSGIMDTGIASGMPIIKKLIEVASQTQGLIVMDCPPGSGCAVIESITEADYCLLVAEPTIFGQHNLDMVYKIVRLLGKPSGVVLNKSTLASNPSKDYCISNGIPIVAEIPFDKDLGLLNSVGKIAAKERIAYRQLFAKLLGKIKGATV